MAKTTHVSTHADLQPTDVTASFLTVEELVTIMNDLRFIIEEENDFLRRGMPSTLFQWREIKQDLSDRYADVTARIGKGFQNGLQFDQELIRVLIAGTIGLRDLTEENRCLLEGAMKASRQRISAVVQSIRRDKIGKSGYSDDGRPMLSRFVSNPPRMMV